MVESAKSLPRLSMKMTQVRSFYFMRVTNIQYTPYGANDTRSEYVVLVELKNELSKPKINTSENVVHFVVHSDNGAIHEYKSIKCVIL